MPVEKVWYHYSFQYGTNNSDIFKDVPHLDEHYNNLLTDFIFDVLEGNPLHGRNKPSWVDKNGDEIAKASSYKVCNIWHYHLGSHDTSEPPSTPNIRNTNLGQQTSDEVIHYTWKGSSTDELVILGFSPNHNYFPATNDKSNPLRSRMNTNGNYPSDKLVDPLDIEPSE